MVVVVLVVGGGVCWQSGGVERRETFITVSVLFLCINSSSRALISSRTGAFSGIGVFTTVSVVIHSHPCIESLPMLSSCSGITSTSELFLSWIEVGVVVVVGSPSLGSGAGLDGLVAGIDGLGAGLLNTSSRDRSCTVH